MYYEEEYPYYEPTIADEIMMEYQQKMKDALLENIKFQIEQTKEENIRLKQQNEDYKKREHNITAKERDLKYKEDNLKREVTNEFYKTNIGDTLKQYLEDSEVWIADNEYYQKKKCNLCNEDRELVASFPNGKTTTTACACAKSLSRYVPNSSIMSMIKFVKNDSRYYSDRKFYLSKSYSPPKKNYSYDYDYQEFKIINIVDEFNENTIKLHEDKGYGERLGFRSKEECQKYCDWLNKKKKEG